MAVVVAGGRSARSHRVAESVASWCACAHPGLPLGAVAPGSAVGELRCSPPSCRPAGALALLRAPPASGGGDAEGGFALLAAVAAWARHQHAQGLHVLYIADEDDGMAAARPQDAAQVFRPGEEGLLTLHAFVCVREGGGKGVTGVGGKPRWLQRLVAATGGGFLALPEGPDGEEKISRFLEQRFPPFALQVHVGNLSFGVKIHPSPYLRSWRPERFGGARKGVDDPEALVVLGFTARRAGVELQPVAGKVVLCGEPLPGPSSGSAPPEMLLLLHTLLGDTGGQITQAYGGAPSRPRPELLALVSFAQNAFSENLNCHGFLEAASSQGKPGKGRLVLNVFKGSGFEGLVRQLGKFCPPSILHSEWTSEKDPAPGASPELGKASRCGEQSFEAAAGTLRKRKRSPEGSTDGGDVLRGTEPPFFELDEIDQAWNSLVGKLEELPNAEPSDFREAFHTVWAGAGPLQFLELRLGLADLLSESAKMWQESRDSATEKLNSKAQKATGKATTRSTRQSASAHTKAQERAEECLRQANDSLETLRQLQSWLEKGPAAV